MFKVLRTGLLRCILYTCPSCDKVCVRSIRNGLLAYIPTHAQICDNVRVQSTTEWIVFSPFSRFRRFRVFAFSLFPVSVLGVFAFSRFCVPPAAPPRAGTQISCAQGGGFIFFLNPTWGDESNLTNVFSDGLKSSTRQL